MPDELPRLDFDDRNDGVYHVISELRSTATIYVERDGSKALYVDGFDGFACDLSDGQAESLRLLGFREAPGAY